MEARESARRAGCAAAALAAWTAAAPCEASPIHEGTLFVTSSVYPESQTAVDLATLEASPLPIELMGAEGLVVGPDRRIYVAESGGWGGPRRIVRFDRDGSHLTTFLDFESTPELVGSGGPEGPVIGPDGALYFTTRIGLLGSGLIHTGIWKVPGPGEAPLHLTPAYTLGNGEALAFLTKGPYAGHLIAADYGGDRVVRVAPPFDEEREAVDFIAYSPCPNGIAVSPSGDVYVANEECSKTIERYTPDGELVGLFASVDVHIRKMVFDTEGYLYAATVMGPVLRFAPDGTSEVIAIVPDGNGIGILPPERGAPGGGGGAGGAGGSGGSEPAGAGGAGGVPGAGGSEGAGGSGGASGRGGSAGHDPSSGSSGGAAEAVGVGGSGAGGESGSTSAASAAQSTTSTAGGGSDVSGAGAEGGASPRATTPAETSDCACRTAGSHEAPLEAPLGLWAAALALHGIRRRRAR